MPIADSIQHAIEMPDGVSATMDDEVLCVQGPNGSLKLSLIHISEPTRPY